MSSKKVKARSVFFSLLFGAAGVFLLCALTIQLLVHGQAYRLRVLAEKTETTMNANACFDEENRELCLTLDATGFSRLLQKNCKTENVSFIAYEGIEKELFLTVKRGAGEASAHVSFSYSGSGALLTMELSEGYTKMGNREYPLRVHHGLIPKSLQFDFSKDFSESFFLRKIELTKDGAKLYLSLRMREWREELTTLLQGADDAYLREAGYAKGFVPNEALALSIAESFANGGEDFVEFLACLEPEAAQACVSLLDGYVSPDYTAEIATLREKWDKDICTDIYACYESCIQNLRESGATLGYVGEIPYSVSEQKLLDRTWFEELGLLDASVRRFAECVPIYDEARDPALGVELHKDDPLTKRIESYLSEKWSSKRGNIFHLRFAKADGDTAYVVYSINDEKVLKDMLLFYDEQIISEIEAGYGMNASLLPTEDVMFVKDRKLSNDELEGLSYKLWEQGYLKKGNYIAYYSCINNAFYIQDSEGEELLLIGGEQDGTLRPAALDEVSVFLSDIQ